ncbi:hypothetical protein ACQ4PT_005694 [Festuca glaucescens]
MELTKQGQRPHPPLPPPAHRAAQVPYPAVYYPENRSAQVPASSYLIVAASQQPAQPGVPTPSAQHPVGRPLSRASLRPPRQLLSVQTDFPEMFIPQPSPPSAGKKMAVSPKVQMLKSLPSQFSAAKRFVHKELSPKAHPQDQFDSVRSKFRATLAAALSMGSDQQMGQQSARNVPPLGSAGGNMQADGGRMQGVTTGAFQDAGKDDDGNVTKVAASRRSEHGGMLHSNLRSDMTTEVRDDMQQETEHVPLGNRAWLCWDPDIVIGASQSMSHPNPKRARMSDVQAGVNVSEIGSESNRAITTDETTEEKKVRIHEAQSLAFTIEEELFKLFGGVNKKYKEKCRSLLFNLKDKNNHVLRERVLSGDITPKCLCAMTIEELASKEFPYMIIPQLSSPSASKKVAVSPKVQMLKTPPSQLSAGKRFVHKELPPKAHLQLSESVRLKFRETLAAALSIDSDKQMGQQCAGNVPTLGSAGGNIHADGGRMQGFTTAFQVAGKDDDENVAKVATRRSEHGDMSNSNLRPYMTIEVRDDMQQQTEHVPLGNKVSGNSSVALDDLLQDQGLCWSPIGASQSQSMSQPNPKRAKMSDVQAGVNASEIGPESKRAITTGETIEEKKVRIHKAQSLAFKIEEELFKLFGGVNKKYKEKGRSLLFNLKDKNNPVLREQVLSGDITPKCLCAMTIEELASKELSEWRMAKAEEFANMVVLPDREVDVRHLVRKMHKGEFQIEVEETDVAEVGLGGESPSDVSSKHVAVQTKSDDKTSVHNEVNEADNSVQDGVAGTCNSNTSNNLNYPPNEKSDLMQELMIDDLKVTENLPQIMALDEFMQDLHSEPCSECQPTGALQDDPRIDKADKALKSENFPTAKDKAAASDLLFHSNLPSPQANYESKLESPMKKFVSILDPVEELKGDVLVKSPPEKVVAEKSDTVNGSIPESTMHCKITPDAALTHGSIWEGSIQLSSSTLTNMVAIFKSGEKSSTNGWRRFLEIKGRVRLSVFEEFLVQLPKSRSRAIMTIDSYIGKERVGLVKLAEGVELYLCPSQGKATQILADHLPKEHSGSLTVAGTSIIGLVVWRRPHATPRVPPNKQDVPKSRATISSSVLPRISQPPSCSSNACRSQQDVVAADAVPGIGPGVVKDDDDLSEYNFVSVSNSAGNVTTSQTYRGHQHTSLSEDRFREMVRKYGNSSVAAHPWNCDGDVDMPEWNPNSQSYLLQTHIPQPQFPYQQQPEYHSMSRYHMTREYQSPLPQAYTQHQHIGMREQQPLSYGHTMQPFQRSYYGVPDDGWQSYNGIPDGSWQSYFPGPDDIRTNDAWNQGLMAWNPCGEKPSTNEWPRLLGIKGRVTELRWKEGSPESGRHPLLETIDSYIAIGRVGVVEVAEGVVMYLCPSQGKAAQILADHLPKEHSGSLTETETSIIGLIVWQRPNVPRRVPNMQDVPKSQATSSSSVLPRISQPPSRSSNACHSHQDVPKSLAKISSSVLPRISQPPSRSANASRRHQDVETADVLLSFDPDVVKDDDDLPEYNFGSVSNSTGNVTTSQTYMSHQHTSLPEDRMREMVRKYGDRSVAAQPWNHEGDEFASMVHKHGNLPQGSPNSQSNLQEAQIPQPQFPYQQQLQYHSMLQYHMTRESKSPSPQAYPRHQHLAMPVEQPLNHGHLMQPAEAS